MTRRPDDPPQPGDLNPVIEPDRWEHLVNRIHTRAVPRLAERRREPGLLEVVAEWARPALAAAASVLLLVGAGSVALDGDQAPPSGSTTFAEAVVPGTFARWLSGESQPTVADLMIALEEVER